MLSSELSHKLRNLKNFLGVFSRDTLPIDHYALPCSLVCNTDTQESQGSHWICIFIDQYGNGEYFDSYGLPPLHHEFIQYLTDHAQGGFMYNKTMLQCLTCTTCGEYCAAYLILRSAGYSYDQFINLFTTNTYNNDLIIKNLFATLN